MDKLNDMKQLRTVVIGKVAYLLMQRDDKFTILKADDIEVIQKNPDPFDMLMSVHVMGTARNGPEALGLYGSFICDELNNYCSWDDEDDEKIDESEEKLSPTFADNFKFWS